MSAEQAECLSPAPTLLFFLFYGITLCDPLASMTDSFDCLDALVLRSLDQLAVCSTEYPVEEATIESAPGVLESARIQHLTVSLPIIKA